VEEEEGATAELSTVKLNPVLSRALRVKNETSISENLAHDTGPSLKIGVGGQLFKRVFISKHISLKVPIFLKSVVFSDFPLNAVKI
jgi:hypothetical protein